MTDDKKRVVIKSYLRSQVGEFIRGKDLIFKISGLKDDVALDGFLLKLAEKSSDNYLEYLKGRIKIQELKKLFKREVRLTYRICVERPEADEAALVDPAKVKIAEAIHLEFLYNYAEPIFFNFEDELKELEMIFLEAGKLAKKIKLHPAEIIIGKKSLHPARIFREHREKLLSGIYSPKGIKRRLQRLFSLFSVKETLEKLGVLDEAGAEKVKSLLDEKRLKAEKMRILNIALETFINLRTVEILSTR